MKECLQVFLIYRTELPKRGKADREGEGGKMGAQQSHNEMISMYPVAYSCKHSVELIYHTTQR